MQRYGLSRYFANNLNISSPTCCDAIEEMRQTMHEAQLSVAVALKSNLKKRQ
jgi:hypothetical protein